MRQLTTRPLAPEHIGQAFPLIQAYLPRVSLDEWRKFAAPLTAPRARSTMGIITVISERDYIAGLSTYRVAQDLQHGPALLADNFMALDLFDREAVIHALAEALETLGRMQGCTAIHTHALDRGTLALSGEEDIAKILLSRGHRVESIMLCKVLEPPAGSAPGHSAVLDQ